MPSSLTPAYSRIPLTQVFADVPDPRDPRGVRHALPVILTCATAAVRSGAKTWVAVAEWVTDADRESLRTWGIGAADVLPSAVHDPAHHGRPGRRRRRRPDPGLDAHPDPRGRRAAGHLHRRQEPARRRRCWRDAAPAGRSGPRARCGRGPSRPCRTRAARSPPCASCSPPST